MKTKKGCSSFSLGKVQALCINIDTRDSNLIILRRIRLSEKKKEREREGGGKQLMREMLLDKAIAPETRLGRGNILKN